jgi:hypothetical protein
LQQSIRQNIILIFLEIPDSVASMAEFHAVPLQTNVTPWGALYNLFFSSMPYTATRFLHKKFEKELITILQTQSLMLFK